MTYNQTKKRVRLALLCALPLAMLPIMGADGCVINKLKTESTIKMEGETDQRYPRHADHAGTVFTPGPFNYTAQFPPFVEPPNSITDVCTDQSKVVCEWKVDPNEPRLFEYTNGTNGHHWQGSPEDEENHIRCAFPKTVNGVCEPHADLVSGPFPNSVAAVTVGDIGYCSSKTPTNVFMKILTDKVQEQAEERLGDNPAPEGSDIPLWLDFLLGLKMGDWPVEAFLDTTVKDGTAVSEVVMRQSFRLDGDLQFKLDPDWLGDSVGAQFTAVSLQLGLMANPLTFLAPIFLGNCEKDRPAVIQVKGQFKATEDGRGVGIRVNTSSECGPDGTWPCTWASVLDWPARRICNQHIKPIIESNLLAGVTAGLTEPDGKVVCVTCTEEGGTILPYKDVNDYPYNIAGVQILGGDIHFIHFYSPPPDPDTQEYMPGGVYDMERHVKDVLNWRAYQELQAEGKCGTKRNVGVENYRLQKKGEHIL